MKNCFRKLTVLLTSFVILLSQAAPLQAAGIYDFTDLDPSAWYYNVVKEAYGEGLMTGLNQT